MLTDDGYRQLMKHAKRLAQEGHGELAQHLRDAIDLRAEVEALRADAQAVAALLPGPYYMDPPDGGSVTVIEQLRRMAADAQRYRWLREQHWNDSPVCVAMNPRACVKLGSGCPSDERLDAAVDAARAAQGVV